LTPMGCARQRPSEGRGVPVRRSPNMALSDQLMDLAGRTKRLEDAAAAARAKNVAKLEEQRGKVETKAASKKGEAESWWIETTTKIDKRRAELKVKHEQHKAERTVEAAKRYADATADQAEMFVVLADYAVDAATEAVVDAAIAEEQFEAMKKDHVKVGS